MTHPQLVAVASLWLRRTCAVVVTEIATTGEEPDAIGWKGSFSTLVECKASKADFRADKDKPFRRNPFKGIGQNRYFLSVPGVISLDQLPDGWGLLEVTGSRVRVMRNSAGFQADQSQEIRILLSCLRRIGETAPDGISIRHYTIETECRATLHTLPQCSDELLLPTAATQGGAR